MERYYYVFLSLRLNGDYVLRSELNDLKEEVEEFASGFDMP
jgi:hypothetical protein